VVKVVTDPRGMAIYFSRSPIPYSRDLADDKAQSSAPRTADDKKRSSAPPYFKHIGLYVYRRDFLLGYSDLPIGPLEQAERLEQLRAIENGFKIHVGETEYDSIGVDTPEDLERVSEIFEKTMVSA
jgi:3-deoxy-manno-octulosonate cytidylyltransferase (CMP-KDO synthetase)